MRAGSGVAVAAVALVAAGCSALSPVPPPVVPTFPATTATTPPPQASNGPRGGLPTDCKDLIDGAQLDQVTGLPLSMVVKSVIGQPSPSVGQTGRLSCSYGLPAADRSFAVALSLTSYRDPEAAADRIPVNVDALRTPDVDPVPIPIPGMTATYLPLRDGPVLIASSGIYSVTVTLGATSFSPEAAIGCATAVANMALTSVRA